VKLGHAYFFTQFRIEKRKQLFFLLLILHGTHNNVNNRMLLQHSSTHIHVHAHTNTTERERLPSNKVTVMESLYPPSLSSLTWDYIEPKVKKEKLQISLSIHPCLIDRCINSHNRWGCSNYSIGRVLNPLSKNKVFFYFSKKWYFFKFVVNFVNFLIENVINWSRKVNLAFFRNQHFWMLWKMWNRRNS